MVYNRHITIYRDMSIKKRELSLKNDTRRHNGQQHHDTAHGGHHRHEGEGAGREESERHHGRGGHGGHRGEGRGGEGRGGEGRGGRARRGEARYVLLDALRDGPKHGYEIIKSLEEKSGGRYSPSPGTVYPTMQLLEDLGLVRADKDAERRVFSLTEAGVTDLNTHTQEIADFWERFAAVPITEQPEIGFLRDDLESLARTVWEGMRGLPNTEGKAAARSIHAALEQCRSEIREILIHEILAKSAQP